jgi:hypothetical protein
MRYDSAAGAGVSGEADTGWREENASNKASAPIQSERKRLYTSRDGSRTKTAGMRKSGHRFSRTNGFACFKIMLGQNIERGARRAGVARPTE